ncbi:MAG: LacI family DNA-binding transcriptional regulator [Spirochaetes bacterium]|nr:LacI family DNA-binding transcriptional regulator [Spirochaetota bacterium]
MKARQNSIEYKKRFEAKKTIVSGEILTTDIHDDDRFLSIRDIAAKHGFTRSTVMRAISDLIEEGVLYSKGTSGIYLADRRKCTRYIDRHDVIISIIPEHGYLFSDILEKLEAHFSADKKRHTFFHLAADAENRLWALHIKACVTYNPAGIVIKSPYRIDEDTFMAGLKTLRDHLIPFVLLESDFGAGKYPSVSFDSAAGAVAGVEYLVRRGHKRLCFIEGYGTNHLPLGRIRRAAFGDAVRKAGVLAVEDVLGGFQMLPKDWNDRLKRLIRVEKVSAFFCYNDIVAKALIALLEHAGFDVPHDVSVLGYDNVGYTRIPSHFTEFPVDMQRTKPHDLTAMSQPAEECAQALTDIIYAQIDDERIPDDTRILIRPKVYEGDTVKKL